ncbi:hypothetical protein VKT23_016142 [Stygiomarasmius scandens]|uniref:Beta-glucuronidase C-terminal domain-containing protein n=1 Tax=Marasmiellus scandens TaxID=2682957 RepID=A0ABR1IVU0_9AGAR
MAYAIYENISPARVALFNYLNDSPGTSAYITTSIYISNPDSSFSTSSSVKVKYLSASVSRKGNFSWAGRTDLGQSGFMTDGTAVGENIQEVLYDASNNVYADGEGNERKKRKVSTAL